MCERRRKGQVGGEKRANGKPVSIDERRIHIQLKRGLSELPFLGGDINESYKI